MPVENSPHRNKRGLRIGQLIALVLGGGFAIVVFWPREPRYEGKTLREWLVPPSTTLQISFGMGQYGFEADTNNAYVRAIQYFGPGAVPVLRRELRAKDSSLKLTLVGLLAKAHLWRPKIIEARVRRQFAVQACQILGPAGKDLLLEHLNTNAVSALPALLNLASNAPTEEIKDAAMKAISQVSPSPEVN